MGSTKTTHRILMGYPGPNCSRSLANRQPANQWLPANHSPASSRLGGQALAVGDGERIAYRQAARPGGGRPGRLDALLHRARLYRATQATVDAPPASIQPRHDAIEWMAMGDYRQTLPEGLKARSRTSPCCTAASYDTRRNTERPDTIGTGK